MAAADSERAAFRSAVDREEYLRANSGLPGPRANLELLGAAAEEVDRSWAMHWAAATVGSDPTDVFVVSVALAGLGRFLVGVDVEALARLRQRASDPEWRIREAVSIALQRLGDDDVTRLSEIALSWVGGNPLEARAAVAAVAEPRLLKSRELVPAALEVLSAATTTVRHAPSPRESDMRVLRQALGYAWSVVIAASPDVAWPLFERLAIEDNDDVRWIISENMNKDRIRRLGLTIAIS